MRGYRVGVVDPLAPFGKGVRERLETRGFPIIELKLFQTEAEGRSTLTRFEDEVVVTQPLDPELFPRLDVLFWSAAASEETDLAAQAAAAASSGVLSVASGLAHEQARVVVADVNEAPSPDRGALFVAPGAITILLSSVLAPLVRSFELLEACATVLVPASHFGEQGIEELHQQTVNLFNFKPPPKQVFSEQLAFNVLPFNPKADETPDVIAKHVSSIAGLEHPVAVSLVTVPVFHAYGLALWVRLGSETVEPSELARAWRSAKRIQQARGRGPGKAPSPVSVAESEKVHVGPARPTGARPGDFWLWASADRLAIDPADNAVRVAARLLDAR